jgi:hypothetical protein
MPSCPHCGRRYRARRFATPPAQLAFAWQLPAAPVPQTQVPCVRLLLLHGCTDPHGDPRPALMPAGARRPIVFPTIAAALAAKRSMEAAR